LSRLLFLSVFCCATACGQSWHELIATADSLQQQTDYDSALTLGRLALDQAEMELGSDDTALAQILCRLAVFNAGAENHTQSRSHGERALAIMERSLGGDHPDLAEALNLVGSGCFWLGEYDIAIANFQRAIALSESTAMPDNLEYVTSMYGIAETYRLLGRLAEAEVVFRRALERGEIELGCNHRLVVDILMGLGDTCRSAGRFQQATDFLKRALEIHGQALGLPPSVHTGILNNLAIVYQCQQDYANAESLYKKAICVQEREGGLNPADLSSLIVNLGNLYMKLGRHQEAGVQYDRALAALEPLAQSGDLRPTSDTAGAESNLTRGAHREPDLDLLYARAVAISRDINGRVYPVHVGWIVHILALYYHRLDMHAYSEKLFLRAVHIREQLLGPVSKAVATSLRRLANLYIDLGRHSEAEEVIIRSLGIWEELGGPNHPRVASSMSTLALLYMDIGRFDEAESLWLDAIAMGSSYPPSVHNALPRHMELLAGLYRMRGQDKDAKGLVFKAYEIRHKALVDNAFSLPEKHALALSNRVRKCMGLCLTSYSQLNDRNGQATEKVCDLIFQNKGMISDEILTRQQATVKESDSTTLTLAEALRNAKFQISRMFVSGPKLDVEKHRAAVDSLRVGVDKLESELTLHSASFRRSRALSDVSTDRLAALLPDIAVLVEYLRYEYYPLGSDSTIPHYLAIVLTKDAEPVIVNLGEASEVDSSVSMYREHMEYILTTGSVATATDLKEYRRISHRLYQQIWQPIETHVTGRDMVIIAPDGALNTISFAGLIGGDDAYLVESCAIHYLSAGRDLVRLNDSSATGSGLLALGNPDYDASLHDRSSSLLVPEDTVSESGYGTVEPVRSNRGELNNMTLSPLPGTRKEIQEIIAAWRRSSDEPALVYLGSAATEDRFRKEAPGKRVIHLATHGYFLDDESGQDATADEYNSEIVWLGENPLLHSGLFFAGANLHGQGADSAGVDDGILTAYEVSALDLRGTELAVLSACETGLGKIRSGEGVYGLRRAFQMAGVETVISNLWSVSDQMTAEISSQLYDRRGVSLPETIRRVQIEKIHELRRLGKVDHPVSWGAVVAYGNWR
jgi:CHAT domain-containing protein/Flp pilus assembly protein TadD